jgi:hypothetical protein
MFFLRPLFNLLHSVFTSTKGQENAWEIQAKMHAALVEIQVKTQAALVNELVESQKRYHDLAQVSDITAYIKTNSWLDSSIAAVLQHWPMS